MLEGNVAEQARIHILEARSNQGVALHVAIGAARADATGQARPVGRERCVVEPCRRYASY